MEFTPEVVDHVALLSRLELDAETRRRMAEQLGKVLDYFNKLDELDTEGVEPMSHPGRLANVFREDVPSGSIDREDALANAPDRTPGAFRVPRVID